MKMRARRHSFVWRPRRNVMLNSVARMLKRRQQLDREEVEQGLRTAQSLWAFKPGTFRGAKVRSRPGCEYEREGKSW